MNATAEKIQIMREIQFSRGMRVASILGFLTLLASLSRVWVGGWHNIFYLHIILYLVVVSIVLLERRLSFRVRAGVIAGAAYILGVGSLLVWGFAAFSLLVLFSFCILSTIYFGTRAGLFACIVSTGTVGIAGAFVYAGALTYRFNPTIHLNSPALWAMGMLGMALSAGIIVVSLGTLNRQVEGLLRALESQNEELLRQNVRLEEEIEERIRGEEERRKIEAELQNAKKMETIGALAGGVAHDLNNILGGIVGYPDLMLLDLPQESPLRSPLEDIKKTGIKAAAIVSDMLTLARRRIDATEVVNLNSVIYEYCESPELEALKKFHPSVEIELSLDPVLMNIHGSPFHLSKVLMNLVSNAAEAMPDGGRILISTENLKTSSWTGAFEEIREGEYSVLSVTDTGVGIAADEREKIFEPFYSKKKLGRSGTGLGMAVVWGSVKDHNGYIDLDSKEGKGTKFTLYFPATQEPVAPAKPAYPGIELRGRGESIVVIDDVKEQREIATRILKELGYSVQAFGSGEEAIEYLKQASADLLILDMLMEPGMDGLETYKRIIELHPRQKAIITTGYAETIRIKEALQMGVGTCLKKPFLIDEISHAIRAELKKEPQGRRESRGIWN